MIKSTQSACEGLQKALSGKSYNEAHILFQHLETALGDVRGDDRIKLKKCMVHCMLQCGGDTEKIRFIAEQVKQAPQDKKAQIASALGELLSNSVGLSLPTSAKKKI